MEDKQIFVDGQFVSERVSQVIAAIKEYSPDLDVLWVPPNARRPDQAAFKVVHRPDNLTEYTLFHVKTEEEFDARVLKRIIMGDQRNGEAPTIHEIEAAEEAAKRVAHQRALDQIEEDADKMAYILKSPLHKYVVDKNIVIKDGVPFNAKDY